MPTRRGMEMTVIVIFLTIPVISLLNLWARKHIVVSGGGPGAEAAAVVTQIL